MEKGRNISIHLMICNTDFKDMVYIYIRTETIRYLLILL